MGKFDKHKKQAAKGKDGASAKPRGLTGFQISIPQCKVCQSPSRRHIDRFLVLGVPAAQVADQYSQIDDVTYSRKSMNNHKNKHLSLHDSAVRRLVEKRAEEAGMDVEEATESLLTARSVLETLVHKGHEGVVSGKTTVRPEDMMAALKHLKEADEEYYDVKLQMIKEDFSRELEAFIDAVRKEVPGDMHKQIMTRFKQNMDAVKDQRAQIEQ